MFWQTTRFRIDLARPRVMGIVNVTPDSFSDGGRHDDAAAALAHCEQLVAEGADILDIGGESSRPGAAPVPLEQELARVLPVLDGALKLGVPVSIDTRQARGDAARARASAPTSSTTSTRCACPARWTRWRRHPHCGVCLMHMRGDPATMQQRPAYDDVVAEVSRLPARARWRRWLRAAWPASASCSTRASASARASSTTSTLLRRQRELLALGRPLLLGWSRKSTLGAITGRAGRAAPGRQRGGGAGLGAAGRAHRSCARCRSHRRRPEGVGWRRTGRLTESPRRTVMSRTYFGTDGIRGTVGQAPDHRRTSCCASATRSAVC